MLLSTDGFLRSFRLLVSRRSLRPRSRPSAPHRSACRRDLSFPSLSLLRSRIADFTFIMALFRLFSLPQTYIFLCLFWRGECYGMTDSPVSPRSPANNYYRSSLTPPSLAVVPPSHHASPLPRWRCHLCLV